jgi:tRNA/rRNA methyltransferase
MVRRVKKENISIVLVEPQIPENIGSVARAMNNMGLKRLILVNPKEYDVALVMKTATTHSLDIVEAMEVYDDLKGALAPFQYVAGTTARLGAMRPALSTPRALAMDLVSISQDNMVAILFGPEDRGLSNDHLSHCHTITTVPTSEFSSLNLSQAVMIVCYEIYIAGGKPSDGNVPRLANVFELEGMYDHMRDVLMRIGFLNPQNPEQWMSNVRRFLSRLPLRAQEVRTIRGVFRQIDWYVGQFDREKND